MGTFRLPVKSFLRARGVLPITIALVVFELSLPLWAYPAMKVHYDDYFEAVPLAVSCQFIPAGLVAYVTGSTLDELETQAARGLSAYRFAAIAIPFSTATFSLLFSCLVIGEAGTLDTLAPVRAMIGLVGIALAATLLMDRRLAVIIPAAVAIYPLVFDPRTIPLLAFTVNPDPETGWLVPAVLAVLFTGLATRGRQLTHSN